jgi:hypothetical protein
MGQNMTPKAAAMLRAYRRQIGRSGETITIRRGSGAGAVNNTVRARAISFGDEELVGDIKQGDIKIVVMAEDVTLDGGIVQGDRVLMHGKAYNIISPPDDKTRRMAGALIAYELAVRG